MLRLMSILAGVLLLAACARSGIHPVNVNHEGVAIKGYDAVSYFTDGRPVKGSAEFSHSWMGGTWHFASQEHLEMFKKEPEKYAPRYGGYCAYAVSLGKTADIDPEAWSIRDGRLYLNRNKEIQAAWNRDAEEYIRKADANWPKLTTR